MSPTAGASGQNRGWCAAHHFNSGFPPVRGGKHEHLEPLVYLVDDDPSVRKALTRLFRVAGLRCETFETAGISRSPEFRSPSCLVLDVNLPDGTGLDLQRELKDRGWPASIVFITGHGNIPMAVEAIQSGAVHFLAKPFNNEELLAAVHKALERAGQEFATADESKQLRERLNSLTPRERDVFLLVAAGMANKNIAAELDISLQTVKLHRGRVMRKLQLDSVADLVRLAEKANPVEKANPDRPQR
ncbi:MAG: response regulator [Planctomycetales bacterium]